MDSYKKFSITAEPFNAELISGLLWTLEIEGVNEEQDKVEVFISEKKKISAEIIHSLLKQLVKQKLINSFNVEEETIQNKNWNREWEKNLHVIEVTDKIVIKPSAKEYKRKKDQVVIEINPKMSFGTGEHQTTKLMLQALEKHIKNGMKILDVGTGTGIIAIAAVKLGASSALGIDNDEWSILNASENCMINKVNSEVKILLTDINGVDNKDFDLIAANIQKNILIDISEELAKRIKKNGILILSGLLAEDEQDILSKYREPGFKLHEILKMDEWIAVVFQY
jgi:ribosomal protein L11 methyltransferase